MKTFRALTTDVAVSVAGDVDPETRALIAALTAPYAATTRSTLHYRIERECVVRDDVVLHVDNSLDLAPQFELDLYESVVTRADPGWLLHASAVDIAGRALVLSGPSGAGKTTLTLALAARGHRFLTEEIVWISPEGAVCGLARPLHVTRDSPVPSAWRHHPYLLRSGQSLLERTLVVPPETALRHGPIPLHTLVYIGHGPRNVTALERASAPSALHRLWNQTMRQDEQALATATFALRTAGAFDLSSRCVDEALELLGPLLST